MEISLTDACMHGASVSWSFFVAMIDARRSYDIYDPCRRSVLYRLHYVYLGNVGGRKNSLTDRVHPTEGP